MLNRVIAVAALGVLATACATPPTPAAGPAPASPAAPAAAAPVTVLNIAGSSQWVAEERLLPQLPILALTTSSSLNDQAGVSMTCNPDNGKITGRLGKQPANRVGQSAMYRLRTGAGDAKQIEGKFEATKTGDSDFVFPLTTADLRAIGGADAPAFVSDTGEVQWAFVKDVAAKPQAKYIASLKNFATEAQSFGVFCNPK